jgi:branched-chain amino acid transport system permease protein
MDAALLEQMLLGALLALSVYLPLRCGQLSLATPGFYAVGGYVAALLSTGVPAFAGSGATSPLPALLAEMALGGALAGLVALAIGGPVLRLRGIYLAIATIALVEILRVLNLNLPFTGGAMGIFGIPQPFANAEGYVAFTLGLLAVACWLCQRLETLRLGRAMAAIRDDELAAACVGIDTPRTKLIAFVASAVLAGVTGALAAHFFNSWNARAGSFDASITTLAFVVFGGSRLWPGPVLGGLVLTALPELLRPVGDLRLILFGAVILLGPLFFPQGLVTAERLRRLGTLLGRGRHRDRRAPQAP